MLKKSVLIGLLATASLTASAENSFYVVVPVPNKLAPEGIAVALADYPLPAGQRGTPYAGFDFKNLVTVTGDPNYTGYGVKWAVAGSLPSGMSLGKHGVLSGTPTAAGTASFQVRATYKTKTGQQAYTIVINGMPLDVTYITAGTLHTCAITTAGGAKCWGGNNDGQLGDGTTTNRLLPVDVAGLTSGVTHLAAGAHNTCAVTTVGGVLCWGGNSYGQLGNNTWEDSLTPVAVTGLSSGIAKVSVGSDHACALTTAGGVKCWGDSSYGQLGNNTWEPSSTPVDVVGLSGVAQLVTGRRHNCVVTSAGGAQCWGHNVTGQIGDGTSNNSRTKPVDVVGLTAGVANIAAGGWHTCATTTTGGVQCWGDNAHGALGDGTNWYRVTPVAVSGLVSGVAQVHTATEHTCARTSVGGVLCWGQNVDGQLGDGTRVDRWTPVAVLGLSTGVSQVSPGTYHTCARTSEGLKCWGYNFEGALGDGTQTDRLTPVSVSGD